MIEISGWGGKISILKVSGILNPNIKWDQRNGEAYSPIIRRGINSFNLSNLLFLSPSRWETFKCVFHSMGIGTDLLLRYFFFKWIMWRSEEETETKTLPTNECVFQPECSAWLHGANSWLPEAKQFLFTPWPSAMRSALLAMRFFSSFENVILEMFEYNIILASRLKFCYLNCQPICAYWRRRVQEWF